jgi:hypothetical protein
LTPEVEVEAEEETVEMAKMEAREREEWMQPGIVAVKMVALEDLVAMAETLQMEDMVAMVDSSRSLLQRLIWIFFLCWDPSLLKEAVVGLLGAMGEEGLEDQVDLEVADTRGLPPELSTIPMLMDTDKRDITQNLIIILVGSQGQVVQMVMTATQIYTVEEMVVLEALSILLSILQAQSNILISMTSRW